jgi:ADP-ribosylglycohydrolase
MTMNNDPQARLTRARVALEGLSVGDAFGDQFFFLVSLGTFEQHVRLREDPPVENDFWRWTDDTNMALTLYAELRQHGEIDQDRLAASFAGQYHGSRGYGAGAGQLLREIQLGMPWRKRAAAMFEGQGSWGNGAAMRIAPLGAYFADDLALCAEQARLSSSVTHTHPEGIAGGIAAAVATAIAARLRGTPAPNRREFIDLVLPHVPDSVVREKLRHARDLAEGASLGLAVAALGNGSQITAQDTVAFCCWAAGECLASYEDALWLTAVGLGDVDTTCAIVGGIVASYTGTLPKQWRAKREPLPDWALGANDG